MTLDEISAHLEIQQVLYRYCRGVDRGDAEMIAGVYHPDAIDNHGAWKGRGIDFGAYLVPAMDKVPLIGQHHITNILIELSGEHADVESYFVAFHPENAGDTARLALVGGRYLDRFELRNGVWLIADRVVVLDVTRVLDHMNDWPGAAYFPAGGRRERDPSAATGVGAA
ncbi:hypothetical protein sos41_41260 [Alphaproteobacteria bacterium SO-S41]|nr:hypothetical protein sos41_41260 [Alphaproteobacteria bacterium SO-S41]